MPQIQFFQLQPRPSALSQALSSLEPAVNQLAAWLAEQPERERRMAEAFVGFASMLPEEQRQAVLASAHPVLIDMIERHFPGRLARSEQGVLQLVQTPEESLRATTAEEEQRQIAVRRIAQALEPIVSAPPEQRERLFMQEQERLRELASEAERLGIGGWFTRDEAGNIRPVISYEQLLAERGAEARIRQTEAQTTATLEGIKIEWEKVNLGKRAQEHLEKIDWARFNEEQEMNKFKRFIMDREVSNEEKRTAILELSTNAEIDYRAKALALEEYIANREIDIKDRLATVQEILASTEVDLAYKDYALRAAAQEFAQDMQLRQQAFNEFVTTRKLDIEEEANKRAYDLGLRQVQVDEARVGVDQMRVLVDYMLGTRELDLRETSFQIELQKLSQQADMATLQVLAQIDAVAALDFIARQDGWSDEQKQAAVQSLKQRRTLEAALGASEIVSRLQQYVGLPADQTLALLLSYTQALAGDFFDADAFNAAFPQLSGEAPPAVEAGKGTGDLASALYLAAGTALGLAARGRLGGIVRGKVGPVSRALEKVGGPLVGGTLGGAVGTAIGGPLGGFVGSVVGSYAGGAAAATAGAAAKSLLSRLGALKSGIKDAAAKIMGLFGREPVDWASRVRGVGSLPRGRK